MRWLELLEQYDFQIISLPGTKNAFADALSRNMSRAESRVEASSELLARVLGEDNPRIKDKDKHTNPENDIEPSKSNEREKPEKLKEHQSNLKNPRMKATTTRGPAGIIVETNEHENPMIIKNLGVSKKPKRNATSFSGSAKTTRNLENPQDAAEECQSESFLITVSRTFKNSEKPKA